MTSAPDASSNSDDHNWTDPWKDGTIGEFLHEFSALGLTLSNALGSLPYAQRSILIHMAARHTEFLPTSLREDISHERVIEALAALDFEAPEAKCLALTLYPILVGYLATQFFYYRTISHPSVNLSTLKARVAELSHRSLDTLIPNRVDGILSILCGELVAPSLTDLPDVKAAQEADPSLASELEFFIVREVALGSVIWQIADSIRYPVEPKEMVSGRVFISYATADKRKIRHFEKYLISAGLHVWRDEKEILAGSPILDRVRSGIVGESDIVVVFLSANSVESEWVRNEIRMAYDREIKSRRIVIVPVLIADCSIPPELGIKKYVDGRRSIKKASDELITAIKAHIYEGYKKMDCE